jgi:hypothetical protein
VIVWIVVTRYLNNFTTEIFLDSFWCCQLQFYHFDGATDVKDAVILGSWGWGWRSCITGVAAAQSTVVEVAIQSGNVFCSIAFNPAVSCCLCEVDVHMECFLLTVSKTKKYPEGFHDDFFALMFLVCGIAIGTSMWKQLGECTHCTSAICIIFSVKIVKESQYTCIVHQ